jgi:hypothetical protein
VDGRSPTDLAVTRHPLLVALLRTTGTVLAVLVL